MGDVHRPFERYKLKLFTGFRDGYWESLHVKYAAYKDQKDLVFDSKMIWDGDQKNPNAILTVYRHFDSAEVLLGAHGPVPDTVWVMDYQVFEDVYYNLVAGYDLFSPTIHQLNTRLYMEISRIASEDMFLNFLPSDDRANLRAFWNRDTPNKKKPLGQKIIELFGKDVEEKMAFEYPYLGTALKSSEVKAENPVAAKAAFLSKLFNEHFTKEVRGPLSDVQGLKVERNPGFSLFAKDDKDFLELEKLAVKPAEFAAPFGDVAFVRVREGSNAGRAYTIVHNKAHSSVSMLLFEDERREPWRDTLNIVSGFASSYPNMYFDVDHKDLSKFVERVKSVRTEAEYKKLVAEYGVERTSAKFWSLHDWFNEETKRVNPLSAGAFDLNRYAN
ncbi:MAG: hypothetical protein EOP05_16615 [Proteobacteria bacterium]|nr:MAG: hypothetical protein EOP05_16615 [Pseudomonadota bacterium]